MSPRPKKPNGPESGAADPAEAPSRKVTSTGPLLSPEEKAFNEFLEGYEPEPDDEAPSAVEPGGPPKSG